MSMAPDIVLLVTALLVLVSDAIAGKAHSHWPRRIAIGGTTLALVLLLQSTVHHQVLATYGTSLGSQWWRIAFTALLLAVQILSKGKWAPTSTGDSALDKNEMATKAPNQAASLDMREGVLHALFLFSALGMFVLVASKEWLTFFLGLELATLPLIALAAFRSKNSAGIEAGMKMVVMAALAMAINVFGISLIYGAVGRLTFDATQVAALHPTPLLLLGGFLVLAALLFKVAAFPFHMWAPDVYEGSPFAVTAFFAVASKAAGLAAMAKLFFGPLDALRLPFSGFFIVAALASQWIGNLGALRQERFTRFIAYSSIAQAGFFLLAFLGDKQASQEALLFNVFSYALATLTLFYLWRVLQTKEDQSLQSLRGLAKHSPALAFAISLALISLAGIPPLVGFLGKYLVFQSMASRGYFLVLALALANTVVSLYYYAKWVLLAYQDARDPKTEVVREAQPMGITKHWGAWVAAASLILLGVTPFLLNALHFISR
jgi:NADH-quinone oxidoreductase subunit N